jgi:hypothetical protein
MGYHMLVPYIYTLYNILSGLKYLSPQIFIIFVMKTLKLFSSSCLKYAVHYHYV